MIAVGHTSTGVLIGLASTTLLPVELSLWQQVLLTGAVGIVSHYAMDLVPHGHYEFDGKNPDRSSIITLAIDLGLPILVVAAVLLIKFGVGPTSWLVAAGIAGAQLPDVFDGLLMSGRIPRWRWAVAEKHFHLRTHWHNPIDTARATPQGGRRLGASDIWQAATVVLALVLLLSY